MGNTYTGSDVGKGGLEVTEVDGTPDVRGVTKITVSNATLTDDGGGAVTILTGGGGAGGNTLDQAYDQGGAGLGRTIDADSGSVAITVSDTDNNEVLTLTQNDVTNNPHTLVIANTGTGDSLLVTNSRGEAFTVSDIEVVVNEAGANIDFRVEDDGGVSYFSCDANDGAGNAQIGFFGATPAVQQPAPAGFVLIPVTSGPPGSGTSNDIQVDQNFQLIQVAINQITTAFTNYGLMI